jgi:hypothetical protein
MKDCTCEDWKFAVPQINNAIVMWSMRSYGSKYTGKPFKLCPWCGKVLEDDEIDIDDDMDWEVVNEYAMTCDGCIELTMREDLTMDMKTQLSYCDECMEKRK